jgi:hypothetical protein
VTTAQERRRARRLARNAAQGLASSAGRAEVSVEHPIETGVREEPPPPPPVAEAPRDASADVVAGRHRWTAVRGAPARPPAATASRAHTDDRPKRWVAVQPRRVERAPVGSGPPSPHPDALADRARAARDSRGTNGSSGAHEPRGHNIDDGMSPPPMTRALHPRTRAIRITRVKTNGRRRWSVDFLVREPDANQGPA